MVSSGQNHEGTLRERVQQNHPGIAVATKTVGSLAHRSALTTTHQSALATGPVLRVCVSQKVSIICRGTIAVPRAQHGGCWTQFEMITMDAQNTRKDWYL